MLQQQLALQQQFETISNELAAMRRIADRLAARQEEMTQNIATLQSSEQNIGQQTGDGLSVWTVRQDAPTPLLTAE